MMNFSDKHRGHTENHLKIRKIIGKNHQNMTLLWMEEVTNWYQLWNWSINHHYWSRTEVIWVSRICQKICQFMSRYVQLQMVYHLRDVKKISQKKTSKIRCRPFNHLQASAKFFVEILGRLQRKSHPRLGCLCKKKTGENGEGPDTEKEKLEVFKKTRAVIQLKLETPKKKIQPPPVGTPGPASDAETQLHPSPDFRNPKVVDAKSTLSMEIEEFFYFGNERRRGSSCCSHWNIPILTCEELSDFGVSQFNPCFTTWTLPTRILSMKMDEICPITLVVCVQF